MKIRDKCEEWVAASACTCRYWMVTRHAKCVAIVRAVRNYRRRQARARKDRRAERE